MERKKNGDGWEVHTVLWREGKVGRIITWRETGRKNLEKKVEEK